MKKLIKAASLVISTLALTVAAKLNSRVSDEARKQDNARRLLAAIAENHSQLKALAN